METLTKRGRSAVMRLLLCAVIAAGGGALLTEPVRGSSGCCGIMNCEYRGKYYCPQEDCKWWEECCYGWCP